MARARRVNLLVACLVAGHVRRLVDVEAAICNKNFDVQVYILYKKKLGFVGAEDIHLDTAILAASDPTAWSCTRRKTSVDYSSMSQNGGPHVSASIIINIIVIAIEISAEKQTESN